MWPVSEPVPLVLFSWIQIPKLPAIFSLPSSLSSSVFELWLKCKYSVRMVVRAQLTDDGDSKKLVYVQYSKVHF